MTLSFAPMPLHDQISHVAHYLGHLNLRNTMVPLAMLSGSHDVNPDVNVFTCSKKSCYASFQSSWPEECNGFIDISISITLCQYSVNHVTYHKSHVTPHFDHLDLRNTMVQLMMLSALHDADTSTNDIMWFWCQWHDGTEKSCSISFQWP